MEKLKKMKKLIYFKKFIFLEKFIFPYFFSIMKNLKYFEIYEYNKNRIKNESSNFSFEIKKFVFFIFYTENIFIIKKT